MVSLSDTERGTDTVADAPMADFNGSVKMFKCRLEPFFEYYYMYIYIYTAENIILL